MTMIEEGWLVSALQDLGGAIEVPLDGPARVLAARGEPTRAERSIYRERSPQRRRGAAIALAAVAVLVIAIVVARPSSHSASTTTALPTSGVQTTQPGPSSATDAVAGKAQGGGVAFQGPALSTSPNGTPAAPATAASPAPPPGLPAKVVKTGSLDLQVGTGKLSPTVEQLTSQATGLGGYVAAAKTTEGGTGPIGDLTLRVPVDQFENLLIRARALGKPLSVSTSGQDVTAASVDLDARIHALQDTRAQFLQILSKATAIGDIVSVQQQISGLQTEIEQLQGQQKVLADQASLATLSIHLSEPGSPSVSPFPRPPHGLAQAWAHARHSFAHGVEAVVGASGGVLVFLLFAGLLVLAGRLVWPRIRHFLV